MNTNDMKAKISTLWIVVMLNMLSADIIASVITIVFVIGGGDTYLSYIFFASVEVMCILLIIWYAWKLPK